jgi:hypothetical protein
MSAPISLEEFQKLYPWPEQVGVKSLYRFSRLENDNLHHFQHLFIEQKLYHTTPDQFNDPFECKPHYILEPTESEIKLIRKHLISVVLEKGSSPEQVKKIIKLSTDPSFLEKTIRHAGTEVFKKLRICCFTTNKKNLLLWAHYADSHKGVCVEFDATKLPISYAFKVHYYSGPCK